jgi:seryl-tRNA synthetase
MLDIKFVRENPDVVDESCRNRNASWDRERFFELDERRRSLISEVEGLQAKRNAVSKQIGQLMREGKKDEAEAAKAEVASNKDRISELDAERTKCEDELFDLVSRIPNIPDPSVPFGHDDSENPEVRRWGTPREFDFEPKAHWDLGPDLGIIDFDRGVKLAESRFYLLGGMGAKLERALINFMLDLHAEKGFKEWWPPVVTNHETLFGTGQLPKFEDDLFHVGDDMYLIPTAEVVLTNIHRDEVLDGDTLPRYYTAFTPCFREEAGSAGRDTRGIIRVHQFDKVEMVKFSKPEDSMDELESMTAEAERVLQVLGLPVPRGVPVHRRHRLLGAQVLRPRGVAAELQQLQGDLQLLELLGLPGAPRQHPLPRPRALQGHALRAHAERQRPGRGSHHGSHHGELPERRRHHHHPRGSRPLHGRKDPHHARGQVAPRRCLSGTGAVPRRRPPPCASNLRNHLRGVPSGAPRLRSGRLLCRAPCAPGARTVRDATCSAPPRAAAWTRCPR